MKSKTKPALQSEAEERVFREKEDSINYVDWSKAQRAVFPNLKPSTTSISIRLSSAVLMRIKQEANKRDVPYQSLIKLWLNEKLEAQNRAEIEAAARYAPNNEIAKWHQYNSNEVSPGLAIPAGTRNSKGPTAPAGPLRRSFAKRKRP